MTMETPDGQVITHPTLAPAGIWTHIAMSIRHNPETRLIRLSLNGVNAVEEDRIFGKMTGMLPKLYFGANLNLANGLKGTLDKIRVSSINPFRTTAGFQVIDEFITLNYYWLLTSIGVCTHE